MQNPVSIHICNKNTHNSYVSKGILNYIKTFNFCLLYEI